jgi:hypothetical protein
MGFISALSMRDTNLPLEQQIEWHLQYNCYPPVSATLVGACVNAINAVQDQDENKLIDLPDDITWREQTTAPAIELVNTFRLEAWLVDLADDFQIEISDLNGE